jgi:hypothetical protein
VLTVSSRSAIAVRRPEPLPPTPTGRLSEQKQDSFVLVNSSSSHLCHRLVDMAGMVRQALKLLVAREQAAQLTKLYAPINTSWHHCR